MKKFKGIFAVSFIAMMTVGIANANIASQGYVDQEVEARVMASQGTDKVNNVLSVNSEGEVEPSLITDANIASGAAIAQSKVSGLTTALAGKLATSTYTSQVGTVNATNMGTTATTVVAAIKEVAGEAEAAQEAADDAATAASTAQTTATNAQNAATAAQSAASTAQTTATNAQNAASAAQTAADNAQDAAEAAQSTATAAQNAINNLDVSSATGSGSVVTAVTQENGKIAVTKGNVKIPVGGETATTYASIWVE